MLVINFYPVTSKVSAISKIGPVIIRTAGIRKYNYAVAGQQDTTVDGTADGVITSWPEDGETWLYRLKNNFPALLSYQIGQGRVVISNYYSDYARGHSQLNEDEKRLLRDLLSWGRDFGVLPEIAPGGTLDVDVPVVYSNTGGMTATVTKVRLKLRNPNRQQLKMVEIPAELTPGGSLTASFNFNDLDKSLSQNMLGIWWVNYELVDAAGQVVQAEQEGQRVALSKHLQNNNTTDLAITVKTPLQSALEGENIPFQIIARNDASTSRTFNYKVYAVLYTLVSRVINEKEVASGTISLASQGETETTVDLTPFKAYTSVSPYPWDKNWWRFEITENGKTVAGDLVGLGVYRPAAKAYYKINNLTNPNVSILKAGDKAYLELQIENLVPVGYPVDWEITVKGTQNQRINL